MNELVTQNEPCFWTTFTRRSTMRMNAAFLTNDSNPDIPPIFNHCLSHEKSSFGLRLIIWIFSRLNIAITKMRRSTLTMIFVTAIPVTPNLRSQVSGTQLRSHTETVVSYKASSLKHRLVAIAVSRYISPLYFQFMILRSIDVKSDSISKKASGISIISCLPLRK